MVAVPAARPEMLPDPSGVVATLVFPLVHVPPVTASLNVIADPWHTFPGPVMAVGVWFTVTVVIVVQPLV